jgi:hypothetical protein
VHEIAGELAIEQVVETEVGGETTRDQVISE